MFNASRLAVSWRTSWPNFVSPLYFNYLVSREMVKVCAKGFTEVVMTALEQFLVHCLGASNGDPWVGLPGLGIYNLVRLPAVQGFMCCLSRLKH